MSWVETKSAAAPRHWLGPGRGWDRPVAATAGDFATIQLSTEGVPAADRVAVWREEMGPRTFRGAYGATPSEVREGIGKC